MDQLTEYLIFFLASMAAITLLTYLPDRGEEKTKKEEAESIEQGLDPLQQIEN